VKEVIAMTTIPDKAVAKRRASTPPPGVKRPADHQPAKEDVTGPKDTVVYWPPLEDGGPASKSYLIAGENLDDAELLEYFTDENFIGALRIMLGRDQWNAYKDAARLENGRVTASGAAEFLNHILGEVKRGNS
jgi:hypothetical protein